MKRTLPDPDTEPTVKVEVAAALLGVSRWLAYRLIAEGSFPVPTLKLGRTIRVPTRPLLDAIGASDQRDGGPPAHGTRQPAPEANHLRAIAGPGRDRGAG